MNNWSLVLFTLLSQSAVGLLWTIVFGDWLGQPSEVTTPGGYILVFLLTLSGLAAALGHLGSPRNALHAVHNLPTSWLSREISAIGSFSVSVLLLLLAVQEQCFRLVSIIEALSCGLGFLALFTMARVYRIKSIPVWDSPPLPWIFLVRLSLWGPCSD